MTTYKSNKGIPIDFDALVSTSSKNSSALGNMRVNAQGDVLGPNGTVVQKNEDRVRAYYKNNPRSSTASASLKGEMPAQKLQPDTPAPAEVKTAKTAKENVRTAPPVVEPEEFDAPIEPVGYKEVTQPNGDIEMVPVYKKDE